MATPPVTPYRGTTPPKISFLVAGVPPPSPWYVSPNERLYIRSRNSAAGVRLLIRGHVLRAEDGVNPFEYQHTPGTDRSLSTQDFAIPEGFLLDLAVHVDAGTPRRGQSFVQVGIARGSGAARVPLSVCISDYVTVAAAIGWPGSPLRSSVEGPGFMRVVTGTDPAAGVEIVETVPTDARWKIHGISFILATDGNVANRLVSVVLDDGTSTYFRASTPNAQVANTSVRYSIAPTGVIGDSQVVAQQLNVPIGIVLFQGHRYSTLTSSIQVGDNFTAPVAYVEEWIED